MPLYEYYCPACKNGFEVLRPMSQAESKISCPKCNNGARKVLSTFATVSSGSPSSGSAPAPSAMGGGCCGGGCCRAS